MFGYLRLFSMLSLLAVVILTGLAGMYLRNVAVENLMSLVDKTNTGLAQSYISSTWKNYRDVIVPLAASDVSQLRGRPEVGQFAQETVRYFQNMPLTVRVNVYSAQGTLLLTHNAAGQMPAGTHASPDAAHVNEQLKQGKANSRLLENVSLPNDQETIMVQTVVPIRMLPNAPIEGVLELLYDMQSEWDRFTTIQIYGMGAIIAVFLMFLTLMFIISRKAEGIISKQYETNMELAAAAAAAQAENRQKSQFLANVSHELRTPLNAIIGFSEIIKEEVITPLPDRKYHDYISDIHASGVHLLSLINDILDYSKAEAGKLELEVSEVNATKMVQNCLRLVGNQAEAVKVTLTEALPKEQIIMLTDSKKFKQVFLNLLSNAIKFTPANGTVRVSAWQNITEDTYTFEVRDTGIGIAPKDISLALAPFGQVDNTLSRKYEGTGLGLPLTKKFVELMGGVFSLESEINVGTTITFTLPRQIKEREGVTIRHTS